MTQTLTIEDQIADCDYWYHKIELPGGVVTPGWAPIDVDSYALPEDLTGKRVLDVGAWDGFWTWECLKRGADFVLAIDDFSDPGDANTNGKPRKGWKTFDICCAALGYDTDRVHRRTMSLYDLRPWQHGTFDVVLLHGVLYHCRYPLKALDTLAEITEQGGMIHVETAILDDHSPYGYGYPGQQMVMEFYPEAELGGIASNWWSPTLFCLGNMLKSAGYTDVRAYKLTENPEEPALCRGFAKGVRK